MHNFKAVKMKNTPGAGFRQPANQQGKENINAWSCGVHFEDVKFNERSGYMYIFPEYGIQLWVRPSTNYRAAGLRQKLATRNGIHDRYDLGNS